MEVDFDDDFWDVTFPLECDTDLERLRVNNRRQEGVDMLFGGFNPFWTTRSAEWINDVIKSACDIDRDPYYRLDSTAQTSDDTAPLMFLSHEAVFVLCHQLHFRTQTILNLVSQKVPTVNQILCLPDIQAAVSEFEWDLICPGPGPPI